MFLPDSWADGCTNKNHGVSCSAFGANIMADEVGSGGGPNHGGGTESSADHLPKPNQNQADSAVDLHLTASKGEKEKSQEDFRVRIRW